ncbi:TetR/AcrR family transcriptional regulator [Corynebacterium crudilactis]|uniref:TetR family transcriptional regulator n=1 Tax=Corynebacterium crudilactis TaxID=1652495 RepID=A0A172QTG4_9CORY|nr:TetR/AcrR family transcriptional regulator [Corynebacterium crudilactis]ANE03983.1 TetR family transcriptional regulator [Corynebacterium crudilactis]
MSLTPQSMGRRERSKQDKLDRITAAASALFAEKGINDVTTQQIAEKADIGTGTLFLYAKTKGELLLLVQNVHYAQALSRGQVAAQKTPEILDALLEIIKPIVECNRVQVDNGRTYLKEMVFGDPSEPHQAQALSIVASTEQAYTEVLQRNDHVSAADAGILSRVISSITFLTMASTPAEVTTGALLENMRSQIAVILPH